MTVPPHRGTEGGQDRGRKGVDVGNASGAGPA
jgi:hypothetical protein